VTSNLSTTEILFKSSHPCSEQITRGDGLKIHYPIICYLKILKNIIKIYINHMSAAKHSKITQKTKWNLNKKLIQSKKMHKK
jgi:hypothetical protein